MTFIPRTRDIKIEMAKNPMKKIMLAKKEGKTVAGFILRYFNGIMQQCALAISDHALKSNIFLTWLRQGKS